jgi:hypothetical protein
LDFGFWTLDIRSDYHVEDVTKDAVHEGLPITCGGFTLDHQPGVISDSK